MLGFLGEKMDPHIDRCSDCREARASYARIAAALGQESTRPVPDDWMEDMKARLAMQGLTGSWPRIPRPPSVVERSRASSRRPRAGWLGGAGALAATAAAGFFLLGRTPPEAWMEARMKIDVEKGAVRYRSAAEAKHTGDVLHVQAGSGDAEHFELRVYLDGERLVLQCPGAPSPACHVDQHGVGVTYTFETPGKYEVYWLLSNSVVARPAGSLDMDMDAAFGAGAKIQSKELIYVD